MVGEELRDASCVEHHVLACKIVLFDVIHDLVAGGLSLQPQIFGDKCFEVLSAVYIPF